MNAPGIVQKPHPFQLTSRTAQVGWLLFMLLTFSLALPGIGPFQQLLQTTCVGAACLTGQLTPAEVQTALAFGDSLAEYASYAPYVYFPTYLLLFLTAVLLIWRKPMDKAAVCGAFTLTALATSNLAQATAHTFPRLAWLAHLIQFVQIAGLMPFFGLIPDGRFHPTWLRWLALALVPALALIAFEVTGPVVNQTLSLLLGAILVSILIYRHRSLPASPQQEQVAWMLAALLLLTGAQWMGRPLRPLPLPVIPLDTLPPNAFGFFPVFGLLLVVGALTCLAVAFLNDELFRLEVALNRALVYSLLTLFVVGSYVLVVGYLSLLFQASDNLWFSLFATGLVAALFHPVRQRVQQFVNNMLYGERAAPYEVVAGLGRRLEGAFAPEAILPTITQMVQESLRLPYVAIALEQNGVSEVVTAVGIPLSQPISFPLTHQGQTVGQLLVSPRQGDGELDRLDHALLTDLAQQAGVAVHNVRLTAELQQMSATLQQSRERLVLAREEERRRLRRNLHDELAPTLIGLSLRASTISDLIWIDPAKATQLANNLESAIREAVGNIRRLVYDLRPPALDNLGLLAAIRERALEYSSGCGLTITVAAPDSLPPLPAAVEVAAYRIVQEGLLNVVKHARAQSCTIQITLAEALYIEMADDGIGLPERQTMGVGLYSIQERTAELGGTCHFIAGVEKGTRLVVSLPITVGGGT